MKVKLTLLFLILTAITTSALAWESHKRRPPYDKMGDMRFDNEHVKLTEQAFKAVDAFSFMDSPQVRPLEVCGTVKDFNSASLGWKTLKEREFCPAGFSELSDFFHSMEDYINQGNKCPPLAGWDAEECHTFEHFMGALNATHFSPQTKTIYTQYHKISEAIMAESEDLYNKLHSANALEDYKDYWEECRMEALTYESIAQHYLQDQWSVGHMWNRWGGPEVDDFPIEDTTLVAFSDKSKGKLAYGTLVGGVAGMIHGWKSSVDPILMGYFQNISNDEMCYHTPGVEWIHPDLSEPSPGTGDLFLDQEGDFAVQKKRLALCMEDSLRDLDSGRIFPESMCWGNYATNRAMNKGLNNPPNALLSQGLLAAVAYYTNKKGIRESAVIETFQGELLRLSAKFAWAGIRHPDDTYLAEGYTSQNRNERLTFFGIMPNDEYNRLPSYIDPAREAPGDPADTTRVQPENDLFGVRQVKYFNKCHAELYCDDPEIVTDYRDGCLSENNAYQEVDCQICEELAGRYFLGDPPLCSILAPGVELVPDGENPPDTIEEVKNWCRDKHGGFPIIYEGTGTYIYTWVHYQKAEINHQCIKENTEFRVTLSEYGIFDVDFVDTVHAYIDHNGDTYFVEIYDQKIYFDVICDHQEPDPYDKWSGGPWGKYADGSLLELNQYAEGEFSGNYSEIYLSGEGYTVKRGGTDDRIIDKYFYSFDNLKNVEYYLPE